jgi:hypothetical protein
MFYSCRLKSITMLRQNNWPNLAFFANRLTPFPWGGSGTRKFPIWSGSVLLVDWFPCRGSIWIRAERPRGDEPVSREGWILWAARRGVSWGRPPLQHRAARAWPLILRAPSTVCRPPRAHIEVPDPNPSSVRFCSVPSPHFPLRPALSILLSSTSVVSWPSSPHFNGASSRWFTSLIF